MQAVAAPWQVPTCASRRRGGRAGKEGLDDDSSSASRPLQAIPSRFRSTVPSEPWRAALRLSGAVRISGGPGVLGRRRADRQRLCSTSPESGAGPAARR